MRHPLGVAVGDHTPEQDDRLRRTLAIFPEVERIDAEDPRGVIVHFAEDFGSFSKPYPDNPQNFPLVYAVARALHAIYPDNAILAGDYTGSFGDAAFRNVLLDSTSALDTINNDSLEAVWDTWLNRPVD